MVFPQALLKLLAGLLLLFRGGEAFVAGASQMARRLGIPAVVIGLTVVSLGTSAPELAVALMGIERQDTALVLGNVLGSNLFNLLVVLGSCALVLPLRVSRRLVRRDLPVLLIATLAVWGMAAAGRLLWPAGLALLVGLTINLVWELVSAIEQRQRQRRSDGDSDPKPGGGLVPALGLQGLGIGLLVLGSDLLLSAARLLEVDQAVIGLTLVAAGTSLPELVTSLVAAYRGRADLAIGNAVGSSLLNLPLLWSYATITATDGALLLLIYGLYLVEQVVLAKLPTAIGTFRLAMLVGTGPVLAFWGWSAVSWWRVRGSGEAPPPAL